MKSAESANAPRGASPHDVVLIRLMSLSAPDTFPVKKRASARRRISSSFLMFGILVGEYDKEDKPTKQIAREMFAMVTTINTEILPKIKNIRSPNPTVNCSTRHRGQTRPGAGSAAAGPPRAGGT